MPIGIVISINFVLGCQLVVVIGNGRADSLLCYSCIVVVVCIIVVIDINIDIRHRHRLLYTFVFIFVCLFFCLFVFFLFVGRLFPACVSTELCMENKI